jgi:hypothetical protein
MTRAGVEVGMKTLLSLTPRLCEHLLSSRLDLKRHRSHLLERGVGGGQLEVALQVAVLDVHVAHQPLEWLGHTHRHDLPQKDHLDKRDRGRRGEEQGGDDGPLIHSFCAISGYQESMTSMSGDQLTERLTSSTANSPTAASTKTTWQV